jgi:hypothetical protein
MRHRNVVSLLKVGLEVAPFIAACAALLAVAIAYKSSQDSVRAQYVGLAIEVLKEPKKAQSERTQPEIDLRAWAVKVLEKNSPVPLPQSVATELNFGGGLLIGKFKFDEATKKFHFERFNDKSSSNDGSKEN